jgi:hypothetical protein
MDRADAFRRAEGAVPADVRDRLARPSPWPAGVRRTRCRRRLDRAAWALIAVALIYFGLFVLLPTLAGAGIGRPPASDPGRATLSSLARAVARQPIAPRTVPAPVPPPIPRLKPARDDRSANALERQLCEVAARIALAYRADDGLPPATAAEVAMIEAAWRDIDACTREGTAP